MSYANGSYYVPPSRPTSAQSPSDRLGQSSVKTRLAFSSVNTPSPKRPLVNHNFTSAYRSSSATPPSMNGHYQSRIGEYHMSRQNPNVLDQMYSPNQSTQGRESVYTIGSRESPLNGHRTLGVSPRLGGTGAVSQVSFLRQMLNSRRARSASPGLVQLANRNGVGRTGRLLKYGVVGVSPVTVKLAGVKGIGEKGKMQPSGVTNGLDQNQRMPNPCDKEVVLSALRQKRKRWASSAPEESPTSLPDRPSATPLPKVKRSRMDDLTQTETFGVSVAGTNDRKRSHATLTASIPSLKRSKVIDSGPSYLSEAEEKVSGVYTSRSLPISANSELKPTAPITAIVSNGLGDGRGSRGHTPSIVMDEVEMDRKRDESLNSLKAVFTSSNEAKKTDTSRRKLPIFCATGARPHLPSPLSATHSVTREDLRKDREATAARLKAFLEADDEEDETDGVASAKPSTQLESVRSLAISSAQSVSSGLKSANASVGVVSTAPSGGLKLGPVSTAESGPSGLALVTATTVATTKSLPTKTVSFAPLPKSSSSPLLSLSNTSTLPSSGTVFGGTLGNLKTTGNMTALSLVTSQSSEGQVPKSSATTVNLSFPVQTQQKSGMALTNLTSVLPSSASLSAVASTTVVTSSVSQQQQPSKPVSTGSLFQLNPSSSVSLSGSIFNTKPLTTSMALTNALPAAPQLSQSKTLPSASTAQTAPLTSFSFKMTNKQPANPLNSGNTNLFGNLATSQPNTQSIFGQTAQPPSKESTTSQAPPTFNLNTAANQSLFNSNSQLFQAPQTGTQVSKPSTIFGQNSLSATQPSIFGQTSQASTQPSIFSQNTLTTSQPPPLNNTLPTLGNSLFGKSQAPTPQALSFNFSSGGGSQGQGGTVGVLNTQSGSQFNFGSGGGGGGGVSQQGGLFSNKSTNLVSSVSKQTLNLPGQSLQQNVFNSSQTGQSSMFGKTLPASTSLFPGNAQTTSLPLPRNSGQQQVNLQTPSTFQFASASTGQQAQPFSFNPTAGQPTVNFGVNQQQIGGSNMFQSPSAGFNSGSPSINFSATAATESTPRKMVTARRRRNKK